MSRQNGDATHLVRDFGLGLLLQAQGAKLQEFTDDERECISKSIAEKVKEGMDQDQAVAASIAICAPSKSTSQSKNAAADDAAVPKPDLPGGKHTARQNRDGTWNVEDVAIFAEHQVELAERNADGEIEKKQVKIGKDWMVKAAQRAFRRFEEDEFLPPLHIHHHDMGKDTERAGFFKVKSVRQEKLEGKDVWTIIADLVNVPAEVYRLIRQGQLPYRSVEILDITKPEISSLALLDDEVPFFRFKLLTIGQELPADGSELEIGPINRSAYRSAALRAYQQVGAGARVLMYMGGFVKTKQTGYAEDDKNEDDKKKRDEKMAADGGDAMKIAMEAFRGISQLSAQAAEKLAAMAGGAEPADDKPPAPVEEKKSAAAKQEPKDDEPSPSPSKKVALELDYTAGATTMKRAGATEVEKLRGEVDGMKFERDLERKVTSVARELTTYGLDEATTSKKLYEKGKKHGLRAIDEYAEGVKEAMESDNDAPWKAETRASSASSKCAAKFAKHGTKAVELAEKYAAEYDEQAARGLKFTFTKEQYIKDNLVAEGIEIPEEEEAKK